MDVRSMPPIMTASEKNKWFLTTNSLGGNVEIIELGILPFRMGR
jgi:hypothetical protein